MLNIAAVIPANDRNSYHKNGDLAPFGDTTLIEWKINQLRQVVDKKNIYVTTSSEAIIEIAKNEDINVIERPHDIEYGKTLSHCMNHIKEEYIIWTIPTTPFVSVNMFKRMIDKYESIKDEYESLISVKKMKEYVYYKGEKVNFGKKFMSRRDIEPIYQVANACFVTTKKNILESESLFGNKDYLFEIDNLASIEIKDIDDFTFANNLISHYFEKSILEGR